MKALRLRKPRSREEKKKAAGCGGDHADSGAENEVSSTKAARRDEKERVAEIHGPSIIWLVVLNMFVSVEDEFTLNDDCFVKLPFEPVGAGTLLEHKEIDVFILSECSAFVVAFACC